MSTMREKMKELCGYNDLERYRDAYESIVCELGFENVHALLPATDDEIEVCFEEDEHLNNILIRLWDQAGGWTVTVDRRTQTEDYRCNWNYSLPTLIREKLGVNGLSCSECVSILKACARMVAQHRNMNPLYAEFQWKQNRRDVQREGKEAMA